jgi:hypothetical protein
VKTIFLTLIVLLGGCLLLKKPLYLIAHKEDFVWTGDSDSGHYEVSVLSNEGIWFEGMITRNTVDTFYLRGFEKGSHYVTTLRTVQADTVGASDLGHFSLWCRGWHADTVELKNTRDSIPVLPIRMQLYKKRKTEG